MYVPCFRDLLTFLAAYIHALAVYPLIFHSIPDEIPQDSQPLITRLYQLWLVLLLTLIINMVACILFVLAGASDAAKDLGTSIVYVALFLCISASAHCHAVTSRSLVSCRFCYGIGKSTSRLLSMRGGPNVMTQRPIYNGYMKVMY